MIVCAFHDAGPKGAEHVSVSVKGGSINTHISILYWGFDANITACGELKSITGSLYIVKIFQMFSSENFLLMAVMYFNTYY
jgi:hypothetical protein